MCFSYTTNYDEVTATFHLDNVAVAVAVADVAASFVNYDHLFQTHDQPEMDFNQYYFHDDYSPCAREELEFVSCSSSSGSLKAHQVYTPTTTKNDQFNQHDHDDDDDHLFQNQPILDFSNVDDQFNQHDHHHLFQNHPILDFSNVDDQFNQHDHDDDDHLFQNQPILVADAAGFTNYDHLFQTPEQPEMDFNHFQTPEQPEMDFNQDYYHDHQMVLNSPCAREELEFVSCSSSSLKAHQVYTPTTKKNDHQFNQHDDDHVFQNQPILDFNVVDDQMMMKKVVIIKSISSRAHVLESASYGSLKNDDLEAHGQGGTRNSFELHFGGDPDPSSTGTDGTDTDHIIYSNYIQPMKTVRRAARKDPAAQDYSLKLQRRMWVRTRSKIWWESCNGPDFPKSEFKKVFRMSRATFDMICQKLDSALIKQVTSLRQPIPVRQRVAICIYRLATGEPLRRVSAQFGVGISTCHKLVIEVCTAIQSVLMPMYLKWPNEEKLKKIKHEFKSMYQIGDVAGSIYTTHIPIAAPKANPGSYLNQHCTERNQKKSYSVAVQGVVDHKGIFTDISIGWPGSLPNAQVLEKTSLHLNRRRRRENLPYWVVGNSGFPWTTDWLLTPHTHQNLTWTQKVFNDALHEIESNAKSCFGRLKGRWVCLQKKMELNLADLRLMIGACCVLHNICEMRGEEEMDEPVNNAQD